MSITVIRTFDDIAIGDSTSLTRTVGNRDTELFAIVSGDVNPSPMDAQVAGIVPGARMAIMLFSRAHQTLVRLASRAMALLLACHEGRGAR